MLFGKTRYNYLSMVITYIKLVPEMALVKIVYNLINALIPTVGILLTASFVNNSVEYFKKNVGLTEVLIPLLGIIGIRLFKHIVGVLVRMVSVRASNKLKAIVMPCVAAKKASIQFKHYENSDDVDTIQRAFERFDGRLQDFFDQFFAAFTVAAQIIGFVTILGLELWWAAILFTFAAVPSFIISYCYGKKQYDVDREMSKVDRKAWYISDVLRGRDTVEERYLYQYTNEIDKKYMDYYGQARHAREKVARRLWFDTTLAGSVVFFSGVITVAALIPRLVLENGDGLKIGMFVSLVAAIFDLSITMQETIPDYRNTYEALQYTVHRPAYSAKSESPQP